MNAHSTMWNSHCHQKQNASPLEDLIDTYELIINNDTDFSTRPLSRRFLIIDFALTNSEWGKANLGQSPLGFPSTKEDLDKEVEQFKSKLVRILNNHAKITRITAYSKRWWNEEVAEARKQWAKNKRKLSRDENLKDELKQA